jgi:hypothetical protein
MESGKREISVTHIFLFCEAFLIPFQSKISILKEIDFQTNLLLALIFFTCVVCITANVLNSELSDFCVISKHFVMLMGINMFTCIWGSVVPWVVFNFRQ